MISVLSRLSGLRAIDQLGVIELAECRGQPRAPSAGSTRSASDIEPIANLARIRKGAADLVVPINAEAHALPFPHGFSR